MTQAPGAARVVIVGGGPGGLAAARRLHARGGDHLEIVLVAAGGRATHLAGTLDVALGREPAERYSAQIALPGVRCIDATAEEVAEDAVRLGSERLRADAVIAAPGLALGEVPRWPSVAAAWDPAGAADAAPGFAGVSAGRLVVAACSLPYRCPPAPFALAVGLAELHGRARHMTRVTVATPEPVPLAGVGGEAPALIMEACAAAGVDIERGFQPELGRSQAGLLRAADGRELRYDAAFLVPPHVRAPCLRRLPGDAPTVAVGPAGAVEGSMLYVVGDAAGSGLPRAAGVAQALGSRAADDVLARLGVAPPTAPEPVRASCFMLHYGGALSRVRVSFEGETPRVEIDGPSLDLAPAREGERRRFLSAASQAR
jgi:sulfide:quinone oxidoreductase